MRQALTTITALALCAGLAACDQNKAGGQAAAPADTKAAEQAVNDVETASLTDWKAKKADGVASHYASDATTYLAGQAPMVGRDKIQAGVGQFMQDANFGLDYTNKQTVVAASGDMAYTTGTYHVSYTDPQTKKAKSEDGNYVTVYHKDADGSWKIVEDAAVPGAASTAT